MPIKNVLDRMLCMLWMLCACVSALFQMSTTSTFVMPTSRVNGVRLFADGPVADLLTGLSRPVGMTKSEILKMSSDAAGNRGNIVSLEHFLQPIIRLSRPSGKRGYRWDVLVNGKLVNAKSAYTMAAFAELKPDAKIAITRIRPVSNDVYADSNGFGSVRKLIADAKSDAAKPATPKSDAAPAPTDAAKPKSAKPKSDAPAPTDAAKPKSAKPKSAKPAEPTDYESFVLAMARGAGEHPVTAPVTESAPDVPAPVTDAPIDPETAPAI